MTVGFADLLAEIVHVGCEPQAEQNGWGDISRCRMGRSVIQKSGQVGKIRYENADRRFVDGDGHGPGSSGWSGDCIWSKCSVV